MKSQRHNFVKFETYLDASRSLQLISLWRYFKIEGI